MQIDKLYYVQKTRDIMDNECVISSLSEYIAAIEKYDFTSANKQYNFLY